jgi:hypothetical protein
MDAPELLRAIALLPEGMEETPLGSEEANVLRSVARHREPPIFQASDARHSVELVGVVSRYNADLDECSGDTDQTGRFTSAGGSLASGASSSAVAPSRPQPNVRVRNRMHEVCGQPVRRTLR